MKDVTIQDIKIKLYDQQQYIKHMEAAYAHSSRQLDLAVERADHLEKQLHQERRASEAWKEKAESIELEFDQWQDRINTHTQKTDDLVLADAIAGLLEKAGYNI